LTLKGAHISDFNICLTLNYVKQTIS